MAVFLLETGLLGCLLVLLFNIFLFRDALATARTDAGLAGALAAGMAGSIALGCVGLFYLPLHQFESLAYLYMYFGGLVSASGAGLRADTLRR